MMNKPRTKVYRCTQKRDVLHAISNVFKPLLGSWEPLKNISIQFYFTVQNQSQFIYCPAIVDHDNQLPHNQYHRLMNIVNILVKVRGELMIIVIYFNNGCQLSYQL